MEVRAGWGRGAGAERVRSWHRLPGPAGLFSGELRGAPAGLQGWGSGGEAGSTRHMAASRHHTQPLFLPLLFLSSRSGNWWCWAN